MEDAKGLEQLEELAESFKGLKPDSDIAESRRLKIFIGCTREITVATERLRGTIDKHEQTATRLSRALNWLTFWIVVGTLIASAVAAIGLFKN